MEAKNGSHWKLAFGRRALLWSCATSTGISQAHAGQNFIGRLELEAAHDSIDVEKTRGMHPQADLARLWS